MAFGLDGDCQTPYASGSHVNPSSDGGAIKPRSAEDATTYFQIPSNRVVEIGTQIAV